MNTPDEVRNMIEEWFDSAQNTVLEEHDAVIDRGQHPVLMLMWLTDDLTVHRLANFDDHGVMQYMHATAIGKGERIVHESQPLQGQA